MQHGLLMLLTHRHFLLLNGHLLLFPHGDLRLLELLVVEADVHGLLGIVGWALHKSQPPRALADVGHRLYLGMSISHLQGMLNGALSVEGALLPLLSGG
jgi:hypothetical protein